MLSFARRLFPAVASVHRFSTTARVCVSAGQTQAAPEASEGEQHIINKLTEKFSPSQLQVQDVSGRLLIRRGAFEMIHIRRRMRHILRHHNCETGIQGFASRKAA